MADTTEKKPAGRPRNGATRGINVGIQPELKEKLQAYARRRHRSASSLACIILKQWIESHPEIPEEDDDIV